MAAPSLTYTLTNGTTADASQVMQDFNDLLNGYTDGTKDLTCNKITLTTTVNKVTITAPASAATLTIANNKTFTVSNTLTFDGTDSTTFTFPSTTGTVVTLAATQTLTNKTLTSPSINEAVALTTTATKLNYLTSAGGTTGTTSTNIVFSTSPTLVTPVLGVASATSLTVDNGATDGGAVYFNGGTGTYLIADTSGNALFVAGGTSTTVSPFKVWSQTSSGQEAMRITKINNTTAEVFLECRINGATYSAGATAAGGLQTTGGGTFGTYTASDRRVKENIEPYTEDVSALMRQVAIVKFNKKGYKEQEISVIAQDLAKLFPSLVSKTDDGEGDELPEDVRPWSVMSTWYPFLVKAWQELDARVAALEAA